jgi:DNA replication protein DnaC
VGPPGVGKSHSVTAIAIGAIRAGYNVLMRSLFQLAEELLEAEATSSRREPVARLSAIDVLFLEDFGMKTLRATAAEVLLDIIMRRPERLPTVITTNRPTEAGPSSSATSRPPPPSSTASSSTSRSFSCKASPNHAATACASSKGDPHHP